MDDSEEYNSEVGEWHPRIDVDFQNEEGMNISQSDEADVLFNSLQAFSEEALQEATATSDPTMRIAQTEYEDSGKELGTEKEIWLEFHRRTQATLAVANEDCSINTDYEMGFVNDDSDADEGVVDREICVPLKAKRCTTNPPVSHRQEDVRCDGDLFLMFMRSAIIEEDMVSEYFSPMLQKVVFNIAQEEETQRCSSELIIRHHSQPTTNQTSQTPDESPIESSLHDTEMCSMLDEERSSSLCSISDEREVSFHLPQELLLASESSRNSIFTSTTCSTSVSPSSLFGSSLAPLPFSSEKLKSDFGGSPLEAHGHAEASNSPNTTGSFALAQQKQIDQICELTEWMKQSVSELVSTSDEVFPVGQSSTLRQEGKGAPPTLISSDSAQEVELKDLAWNVRLQVASSLAMKQMWDRVFVAASSLIPSDLWIVWFCMSQKFFPSNVIQNTTRRPIIAVLSTFFLFSVWQTVIHQKLPSSPYSVVGVASISVFDETSLLTLGLSCACYNPVGGAEHLEENIDFNNVVI